MLLHGVVCVGRGTDPFRISVSSLSSQHCSVATNCITGTMILLRLFLLLSPLISLCTGFSKYLSQSPVQRVPVSSLFAEDTKHSPRAALSPAKEKDVSYGEWIRQFRRTVYNHADWIEHRGSDRFFSNLFNVYLSG